MDSRIRFLAHRLEYAQVIDPADQLERDKVAFGATVTYANERCERVRVTIVGADEADLSQGKISVGSPVAAALLGARAGAEITVHTPHGPRAIEVLGISYPVRASASG